MRTTIKVFLNSMKGKIPDEIGDLFEPEDEERRAVDKENKRKKGDNNRRGKRNNSKGDF